MRLNSYYKIKKVVGTRYEIISSCNPYTRFEMERKATGDLPFFLMDPHYVTGKKNGSKESLVGPDGHISLLFPYGPNTYYCGDAKGTKDLLMFIKNEAESTVEIFVALGRKSEANIFMCWLAGGELNLEMDMLRSQATPIRRGAA